MEFKLQTFGMIKNTRVKIEDHDRCTLFTYDDSTLQLGSPQEYPEFQKKKRKKKLTCFVNPKKILTP